MEKVSEYDLQVKARRLELSLIKNGKKYTVVRRNTGSILSDEMTISETDIWLSGFVWGKGKIPDLPAPMGGRPGTLLP